jgi:hypothetical protein
MRGFFVRTIALGWTLAACGDGDATTRETTDTGAGTGSTPTPTSSSTDVLPTGGSTDGPTDGPTDATDTGETGAPAETNPDATNAFTDSSQLTEVPAPTDTGDPPHMCEAAGPCVAPEGCAACAFASDCADELAACNATPNNECSLYTDCFQACAGDPMCAQNCYLVYPGGYDPAWALADCTVCDVCPTSCNYYEAYCATGGGGVGKTETCDQLADCVSCAGCSVYKDCSPAVDACANDPQCQPYGACIDPCPTDDITCFDICKGAYPSGYDTYWGLYDCAVCDTCPASCVEAQGYCAAGGGGPDVECLGDADCVEKYEYETYCLDYTCVECLSDVDCEFPDFPTCVDNFCQ